MPASRAVFVHTVPPLVAVFDRLAAAMLPDVQVMHILDEPLLEHVRQQGRLDESDIQRLVTHVQEATSIGASAVLVTCSTVSPAVDAVRQQATIPVLKIDEAMIGEAVRLGVHIGVIATNRTTLAPTQRLLQDAAIRAGRTIATELVLVEGALPALLAGDGATHDHLVRAAIAATAPQVDVVVLAQASMARVLDDELAPSLAGGGAKANKTPVLASPHLALRELAALLAVA